MFFFFNDTATTEIYTLSLHDALPILSQRAGREEYQRDRNQQQSRHRDVVSHRSSKPGARTRAPSIECLVFHGDRSSRRDRKSTRLNSSHQIISYAVFCLKKKNTNRTPASRTTSARPLHPSSCDATTPPLSDGRTSSPPTPRSHYRRPARVCASHPALEPS